MTDMQRRPGDDIPGGADDQPAGEVRAEHIPAQLRRRRAASWRLPPLPDGRRDPWTDKRPAGWKVAEVESWQRAAECLRAHRLYGRWQVPESVRVSWRRGGEPA